MRNKISYLEFIVLPLCIVAYCYFVFVGWNQYVYGISYTKCIIFVLLLCLNIYLYGIILNDEKVYNKNINLYIILFFMLLISFTFFIGRTNITFYKSWSIGQYRPFYTIFSQLKYASKHNMLKNIVGNLIAFIPLSFLLMLKDKKYHKIFNQSFILLTTILSIEIMQSFTHTGVFDIDDIILNYFGVLIFILIIVKSGLINVFSKIFKTDLNLNINLKYIFYFLSLLFLILYVLILLFKCK